jgi:hypothetical protein
MYRLLTALLLVPVFLSTLSLIACEDNQNYDRVNGKNYNIDRQTNTCYLDVGSAAINVDCSKLPYRTQVKFGLIKERACTMDMN